MTQEAEHELLKLTAEYRREASILCASSRHHDGGANSCIVAGTESSLGLSALASQDPSNMDIPCSFFHCNCCGCVLQPGTNGTTLRVRSVGRGRTRRRRASRKKAKEFQSKKQSSVGGGRTWRQDSQQQNGGIEKSEEDLLSVSDGACRNAVVVTCGSCGWKLKYKGMPPIRQQQQQHQKKNVVAKQEKRKKPAVAPKQDSLGIGDLVSLPKWGAGGKHPKNKKRKKTISDAKKDQKSGLLDFLSSLNDS